MHYEHTSHRDCLNNGDMRFGMHGEWYILHDREAILPGTLQQEL